MARLYLDICLSDIPKERIRTAANGKKYLKAVINPRREPDKDGYDHYLAVSVPQAERSQDAPPLFFGRAQDRDARDEERARMYNEPTYQQAKQDAAKPAAAEDTNDLPF